ncbi:hypothetical protein CJJ18_08715 [Candidatus Williamhamiltonella defendens]|uniref:Transposase IS4-like domain-containing protein n=1 Tax=Candidatus Williamhamiltonella defendens TaxID=138072 RepID=A0AAC9VK84_9ENTR|nr:hypothetical protein CJJ18_08715 [Candidatus Hamiltonella defensa]AWK17001.1 hypothetical protein CCS40_08535 [Candidatus Hamiltonella defensa]
MPRTVKFTLTQQRSQKEAQQQNIFGHGCAWVAGQSHYSGTTADCIQAENLIEGIKAENLLAYKGYDSDQILRQATEANMQVVIPPKKNRKIQREYDKALYKHRHLVENAFLHLKRWRGNTTRYAKNTASFLDAVQIRCLALWLNIS